MRMSLALYERDPAGAEKILTKNKSAKSIVGNIWRSLAAPLVSNALVARAQGDEDKKAQKAFVAAREKTEAKLA